jgi:hypothetical protein
MKSLFILVSFLIVVCAKIEIDIDELKNNSYKIFIDNKQFYCTPKTPPLSHNWSYECESNKRFLRVSCQKCKNECGGEFPTLFPDDFCKKCIPKCY